MLEGEVNVTSYREHNAHLPRRAARCNPARLGGACTLQLRGHDRRQYATDTRRRLSGKGACYQTRELLRQPDHIAAVQAGGVLSQRNASMVLILVATYERCRQPSYACVHLVARAG